MMTEHGTTSTEDLKKLRAPLYEPLKTLADLERQMNVFPREDPNIHTRRH
jgi:hypothetical protein